MLYHVIRRPSHPNITNSSDQSTNNQKRGSIPTTKLMPRYHYSRIVPNSATNNTDSLLTRNSFDGHISKPTMTVTTTSNNNNIIINPYGSFKSTFIPLVTNNRTIPPNRRDFIQIPITREDGTPITANNQSRSVPVTFISQTTSLPVAGNNNNNNENTNSRPNFINLLRPNSKYFQRHFNNTTDNVPPTTLSSRPRLPSVTRRLSLTIPIITTTNTDDDAAKSTVPSSPTRQIPIHLPQPATVTSIPTNSSHVTSGILHSSSPINPVENQKIDIEDEPLSSPTLLTNNNSQQSSSDSTLTSSNISPIRRAEAMAREAIQGIARLQQQRNSLISENNGRSPSLSRRVIINLKNNQSVSLDSRLSSAMKPPPIPSSSRTKQRNNFFHIPVLHEIQVPSHSASQQTETISQSLSASNNNNNNNENYKNEFHLEIPVTITTSNDQENQNQINNGKEDGINSHERIPSGNNNSNQTLKSILKRSSSRETVSRKNVSFMNA
ncbi:unnamed protein product [Rotaria sordida]|uniref:Uncharacterized protein n=1 Tax=Rotaria sordida TaxID=392033 RepID=A0A818ZPY2_9BILA|nr:unnamed protein product [Rotaria sordida]CAF3772088.1 unnamed protein product [Rotaria sordida]